MLRFIGPGLVLVAAFGGVAWAQGPGRFDGQYMGELTLTKTRSGDCTEPPPGALYPLTISRGDVRFDYRPRFDTTLRGKVGEDGVFQASARTRKGFIHMAGRVHGQRVSAAIESPSCNYRFQTKN